MARKTGTIFDCGLECGSSRIIHAGRAIRAHFLTIIEATTPPGASRIDAIDAEGMALVVLIATAARFPGWAHDIYAQLLEDAPDPAAFMPAARGLVEMLSTGSNPERTPSR